MTRVRTGLGGEGPVGYDDVLQRVDELGRFGTIDATPLEVSLGGMVWHVLGGKIKAPGHRVHGNLLSVRVGFGNHDSAHEVAIHTADGTWLGDYCYWPEGAIAITPTGDQLQGIQLLGEPAPGSMLAALALTEFSPDPTQRAADLLIGDLRHSPLGY